MDFALTVICGVGYYNIDLIVDKGEIMPRTKSEIKSAYTANSMYILAAQKKEMKDSIRYYLEIFVACFVGLIMCVVIGCTQERTDSYDLLMFVVTPFMSIFIIVCAFRLIRNLTILRSLNRIRLGSEETVKIECKDVRFIAYYYSKIGTLMIAIIFVGTNHKKYLYVLPKCLGNDRKTRRHVIDKCLFETFEFTCYKGTRMIKHFDVWERYR